MILGVVGCTTTLTSQRIDPMSPQPRAGWDYSLPFAQYDIDIAWTLKSCETLDVDVATTAVQNFVPDSANAFLIDYRSLASCTKISDLQIDKYPNGMLKKVGASAEDRTGPIIVNTATALAKIAITAAGGVPAPGVAPSAASFERPRCNDDTLAALRNKAKLKAHLDAATKRLKEATTRLEALTAVSSPIGSGADPGTQRELLRAARDVASAKNALADAAEAYTKNLEQLTVTRKLRWPRNGDERVSEAQQLRAEDLAKWLLNPSRAEDAPHLSFALETDSILSVPAALERPVGNSSQPEPLRYRVPVKGRLVMYERSAESSGAGANEEGSSRGKTIVEGPVPQLGRIYLLPLQNKAFQNNVLNATFTEDGNLQTAGYTEKTSSAEAATEALAKVAGVLPQTVRDVRLGGAQLEAAELEAKTKVLENRAKLQTAQDALAVSPAEEADKKRALLAADTSLLDAERAKIVAQYLLDQARIDPSKVIDTGKK